MLTIISPQNRGKKGLRTLSYQRPEPLLATLFRVSSAWLRKSSYHQGLVRALEQHEHSWTINGSQQTIHNKVSISAEARGDQEESELRRNDDWISTKEDEKQEQGIRIDK